MAAKVRVLLDVNILLDVLQKREPFYTASACVMTYAETKQIDGMMAAHTVTTLFYLIAKDQSAARARVILTDLLQLLSVVAVDSMTIEQALNLSYKDFEDAVQMVAALQAGAQYLVTRNPRDYQAGPLPVLQPAELIALM